ncbi:MotA/TolQ/ExbB proton channel family protein [Runella slithyformis]|uniref:MotA/TolQ/ExbB proton channel n=1 Tax=Runella slithyformis (strain ATCC 29530 / DSM 19594 / LMG 11500 / NCIMB 11436 / LSU 4) TaxID=761193 RepID=A0A7U3ZRD4_RUNSL|nr:MotA/TolQ/ExbB proton channel family protein [Runella slithyformis]AEI51957.1 MotA/TolQ/ExbB proton channel [Runella slithyformis DSM 19594]
MIELLQNAIGIITNLLLWPVVTLLLYGMGYSLYTLGNMLVESYQRKGKPETITDPRQPSEFVSRFQGIREWKKQLDLDPAAPLWLLHDRTEAALKKRIDRVRNWIKLGPALGLAGTLIPLGSALKAVGVNNMKLLSDELTVAFGATVLGLTAGVIAMIVVTNYERWYALDLAEIRHALEALEERNAA